MIVMDCEKRSSLGPESFGTDCLVGVARSGLKKFARMVRYKTTDTLVRACSVGNGGHRENATVTKGRCSCATTPCCTLTMTNQEDGKGASAPTSNSKTNQTKRNPFSSVLQEPDRAAPNKGDENDRFHRRSSSSSSNGMKSDTEDEEYAYGKIDTVASKPTTTTATSKNKSKKAPQQKHPSRHVVIGEDTDNDDAEEDAPASPTTSHRRAKPPRPSMAATALLSRSSHHHRSAQRRRRRSSGRFLQLGPSRKEARLQGGNTNNKDDDDDTDDDDDENNVHTAGTRDRGDPFTPSQNRTNTNKQQHQPANLSELYQTAIRMNAENKINANNSWNLRLVENIDTFLEEEDDEGAAGAARTTQRLGTDAATRHPSHTTGTAATNANAKRNKRVNFTKASCTLDASVKIYSYRVDDVHLSSYKVLANLNRSNNNSFHHAANNNSGHGDDDNEQDLNDENQGSNNNSKRTRKHASTLETNLGTSLLLLLCCSISHSLF